jgi:diaminopimelate epimerase
MGTRIPFVKMQGVGNDFVVLDARALPPLDWPAIAVAACSRHTGIGADGLLVIDRSLTADVLMRMFNPDGTPDVCGNGMRCVARYVADRKVTLDPNPPTTGDSVPKPLTPLSLTIETLAGIRSAVMVEGGFAERWTVDMGEPLFRPTEIPMIADSERVVDYPIEIHGERILITALSMGTTHSVVFVEELPDDDVFLRFSPALENHPLFPQRTSVMWTEVADSGSLRLRIWERGAGETWGCGTGACAAAVAGILHESVRHPVSVQSRGGTLAVEWNPGESVRLTGPADYVYQGEWAVD